MENSEEWLTVHTLTSDSGFISCWCSPLHVLYLSTTDFMLVTYKNQSLIVKRVPLIMKAISGEDMCRCKPKDVKFLIIRFTVETTSSSIDKRPPCYTGTRYN